MGWGGGVGDAVPLSWRKDSDPGGIPEGKWRRSTQKLQEEREVSSSVLSG